MAAGTFRDYADKSWLTRPAPGARLLDALTSTLAVASIVAIALLGLAAAVRAQEPAVNWKVYLPLLERNRNPIHPPRCPKANAASEPLQSSFASQADGGEWLLDCRYQPGVRV
jgi:hypothetical protein